MRFERSLRISMGKARLVLGRASRQATGLISGVQVRWDFGAEVTNTAVTAAQTMKGRVAGTRWLCPAVATTDPGRLSVGRARDDRAVDAEVAAVHRGGDGRTGGEALAAEGHGAGCRRCWRCWRGPGGRRSPMSRRGPAAPRRCRHRVGGGGRGREQPGREQGGGQRATAGMRREGRIIVISCGLPAGWRCRWSTGLVSSALRTREPLPPDRLAGSFCGARVRRLEPGCPDSRVPPPIGRP
jgi:hypothetical protein